MTRLTIAVAAAAVAVMLLAVPGCAWIAWTAHLLAPNEKIEPVCTIPPDVKILVLVDDLKLTETVDCAAIKRDLTDSLNEELLAHEVVADVVNYDELLDFIADEPVYRQMPFGEVGRKLGADLVLYVRLDHFSLRDSEASLLWQGNLDVVVSLKDTDDHMLWPMDKPGGHPIDPPVSVSCDREESQSYGVKLTEELAAQMADRIARLFYEHEVPPGTKARRERQEADLRE